MSTRQILGSLACGAVLLVGIPACSAKPADKPQASSSGSSDEHERRFPHRIHTGGSS